MTINLAVLQKLYIKIPKTDRPLFGEGCLILFLTVLMAMHQRVAATANQLFHFGLVSFFLHTLTLILILTTVAKSHFQNILSSQLMRVCVCVHV